MDAYSLLLNFEQHRMMEIFTFDPKHINDVVIYDVDFVPKQFQAKGYLDNKFLVKNARTNNGFIQLTSPRIQTLIANRGVPKPLFLDLESVEKQDYTFQTLANQLRNRTIYTVPHAQHTVSVSYVPEVGMWAITMRDCTLLAENQNDLQKYREPSFERCVKAANQFFNQCHNLHTLQDDLTSRSLVGAWRRYSIGWFQVVEHFSEDPCMTFEQVQEFLAYHKLDAMGFTKLEPQNDLNKLFETVYNTQIEHMTDGSTCYFYHQSRLVNCAFIPYKQTAVLNQLRRLNDNPPQERFMWHKYLSNYNLNKHELECFKKVTDLVLQHTIEFGQTNYYVLIGAAFEGAQKGIRRLPQKLEQARYNIKQCMQTSVVILIALGLPGMGHDELFTQITGLCEGARIINSVKDICDKDELVCYGKCVGKKELDTLVQECKRLDRCVSTVALVPSCHRNYYADKASFPFSFHFIVTCLAKVLETDMQDILKQLQEFQNEQFKYIPTDYWISCRFMPENKDTEELYDQLLDQDLKSAILSSQIDDLSESLTQSFPQQPLVPQLYFKEEAEYVLSELEKQTKQRLRKRSVSFKNTSQFGLCIVQPNWDNIDNFIMDCFELHLRTYKNQKLKQMADIFYNQMFKHSQVIYQQETKPNILCDRFIDQQYTVSIDTMVAVADGLIILYVRDLKANVESYDIPVYSYNLDVTKSRTIVKRLAKEIKAVQKDQCKECQVELNQKWYDVAVVKFKPFEVKLQGEVI